MLVVGEKINVISIEIGKAMKERNAGPIVELAKAQIKGGADILDVNIGPASKEGHELMPWLVETIQGAIDCRLSLDTTNVSAMEEGLKVHKGKAMINSASGEAERMNNMLGLAGRYKADVIGLAMTEKGIPDDLNERTAIAYEIVAACGEHGLPLENLFLDPLILPVSVAQDKAMEGIEAVRMFQQLNDPPLNTIVGLSNISNGTPDKTKPILDRVYLTMLMEAGLSAAIMDPLDKDLVACVRAVKIFRNEMLYAHSFMD